MNQSGWRKPTPGLCKANRLAEDGEQLAVPKNQAMLALRRVAPVIGLKPGDLMLLETLVVFTKTCDWKEGARPIVWPSNDYLMENTGYSLSAVKRHLRRLSEAGLIAYRDSSNGKRWGRRDHEGRIVEAYGFDLSPLAARTAEFEDLHASVRVERNLVKELKRRITIMRRTISAVLDSDYACQTDNVWHVLRQRHDGLLEALRRCRNCSAALVELCEAFAVLRGDAEKALGNVEEESGEARPGDWRAGDNPENLNPTVAVRAPHIRITKDPEMVKSNSIENAATDAAVTERDRVEEGNVGAGGRQAERGTAAYMSAVGELTIQSILYACPAFAEMAHAIGGHVRSWPDLIAVAGRIRPIVGISTDAWTAAQGAMSREEAAAAVALITDKYSDGLVTSPGGYLRGLTLKARSGNLQLARSVFGRLSKRQAAANV